MWMASTANEKSLAAAKRMGFHFEEISRWQVVLAEHNAKQWNEKTIREGNLRSENLGRDTAVLSVCWDDWEGGVRDLVQAKMDRQ